MQEKVLIRGITQKTLAILVPIIMVIIGCVSFLGMLIASSIEMENISIILGCVFIALGILLFFYFRCELTITDKRAYGKAAFGKRVDLPIDAISAVGVGPFSGVSIATSSGKLTFSCFVNCNEIHKVISQLLVDRQNKANATVIKQEIPQSNADELKKYKDLLDNGIITQAEFDAKKKDLLGL